MHVQVKKSSEWPKVKLQMAGFSGPLKHNRQVERDAEKRPSPAKMPKNRWPL